MNTGHSKDIVFSSDEAAALAVEFVTERRQLVQSGDSTVIRFPDESISRFMNPFMAGDLITAIGRPQNGKTYFNKWFENKVVQDLREFSEPNQIAIHVTTEVSIERGSLTSLARSAGVSSTQAIRGELDEEGMRKLNLGLAKISGQPLYFIGHSTKRSEQGRRSRPKLDPQTIENAIDYIMNDYVDVVTGKRLDVQLISIDYLQRLHVPVNADPFMFMSRYVDWAKDLALWAGCPVWLDVQAKRDVDDRKVKIPTLSDGQMTSNIEQSSDFVFSHFMPKVYNLTEMPKIRNIPAQSHLTDRHHYFLNLKQKDGPAGMGWLLEFDYNTQDIKVIR